MNIPNHKTLSLGSILISDAVLEDFSIRDILWALAWHRNGLLIPPLSRFHIKRSRYTSDDEAQLVSEHCERPGRGFTVVTDYSRSLTTVREIPGP